MGGVASALKNTGYSTQKQVVIKSWSLSACALPPPRPRPPIPSQSAPSPTPGRHLTRALPPSPKLQALLYYSIVAIVLAYVVGFSIVLEKGYQTTVHAVGTVTVKVKGQALRRAPQGPVTYDATDLTAYENGGVFIATNIMRTEQARGRCAGTHGDEVCVPGAMDCEEGALSRSGRQTGACVPFGFAGEHRCEVSGWCPAEPEEDVIDPLEGVGNFTIFLRTNVKFPGVRDANGRDMETTNANGTEPTQGWNLFTLDEILAAGGVAYDDVAATGADVQMNIYFDCDLDRGIEACAPKVPFEVIRVDTANSSLSRGYNVRWLSAAKSAWTPSAGMTRDPGGETRALVKAAGPRIRVQITGQGRRFDLGRMTTTLGAGLALVGLATAVVDVLLLYVLPLRQTYAALKYTVYGSDEEDRDRSEIEPLVSNEDER